MTVNGESSGGMGGCPVSSLNPVVGWLLDPRTHPGQPPRIELRQTHISYVVLAGPDVYKIKKPVRFSFLDFSTPALRRFFCEEEVRLNRRLAPDVYLGVVAVRRSESGYEFAVHMRRLEDEHRLDVILHSGRAAERLVGKVAHLLARFHERAACGPEISVNGSSDAILSILEDNFANVARFRGQTIDPTDDDGIQEFAKSFLRRQHHLFLERQRCGAIREGHGDLHADHIYDGDPPLIVDCVEFSPRFRYCDVASDLAFLFMDLEFHDAPGLGSLLVEEYVRASGDAGIPLLLPFYACYRAYVRGKVESLRSEDREVSGPEQLAALAAARTRFALAYRYSWAAAPALVVVSGLSGTGKSSLSSCLAARTGYAHLNSDLVRKHLAGLAPTTRLSGTEEAELYSPEMSRRTYAELAEQARRFLLEGRGAVVDATFQRRVHRDHFARLAEEFQVPLLFVECTADKQLVRQRLTERSRRNDSASDADWEVYLAQQSAFEAYPEEARCLRIETSGDTTEASRVVEAELRRRSASNL